MNIIRGEVFRIMVITIINSKVIIIRDNKRSITTTKTISIMAIIMLITLTMSIMLITLTIITITQ